MAIVVRPNKTVGGGGTAAWIDGNKLTAAELNADILALLNDYNGNITNANIAALAGIQGSKFADASIPTAKYIADSVDSTVLKDDPSVDGNRAVTRNHIRDAAINKAKVDFQIVSLPASNTLVSALTYVDLDTLLSLSTTQPLLAYLTTAAPGTPMIVPTFFQSGTWKVRVYNATTPTNYTLVANTLKIVYLG